MIKQLTQSILGLFKKRDTRLEVKNNVYKFYTNGDCRLVVRSNKKKEKTLLAIRQLLSGRGCSDYREFYSVDDIYDYMRTVD